MTAPTPAELQAYFDAHGIKQVECLFPDVSGYPRGKLMPARSFAAGHALRIAQAIPMQSVTGGYADHPVFPPADPDVQLVPDLATLRAVPWATTPRALAVHDCIEPDGSPCAVSVRSALQAVLARYRAAGLRPVVATELEFYLTLPCTDADAPLASPVTRSGRAEVGQSAFSLNTLNELAPFWDEFRRTVDVLELGADTWLHEMGPAQYEVNLLHGDALAAADRSFLFKYAAKETALKHGLNAVFMAKPLAGQPGSSMHLHQSVVDADGRNVFCNPDGSDSTRLLQFIAGQQALLPELMPLFAPFVNSYRRFARHTAAPVNLHWGHDNRSAGFRIPPGDAAARRVENRIAGADANPYLAIAASLAAGLAGIEQSLVATAPVEGDCYAVEPGTQALPRSLDAALERLQASTDARRLLGTDFVDGYCAVKALELDSYLHEISPWERRYLVAMA